MEATVSRRRFRAPAGTIVIRIQRRKIFFFFFFFLFKRIRGTLGIEVYGKVHPPRRVHSDEAAGASEKGVDVQ